MSKIFLGGHRGMGCTDHEFYRFRDLAHLPVENSADSIRAAYQAGAAYVETDAVMSADGILFALHNVVPRDHFFAEQPPAILNNLAFRDFHKLPTGRSMHGALATLDEVLEIVAIHDPITLSWAINIEIKGVQGSGQPYETNNYLERLAKLVTGSSLPAERVLWSSFCFANIAAMSHHLPQSNYGMLFGEKPDPRAIYADHADDPQYQYLPFTSQSIDLIADAWWRHAHPDARLGYAHPEITTINSAEIDALAHHDMGINCWALFEQFDDNRAALYIKNVNACQARRMAFTAITDYLPQMLVL